MLSRRNVLTACLSLALFLSVPAFVSAQLPTGQAAADNSATGGSAASAANVTVHLTNPLGTTNVPKLVGQVLNVFLGILGSGAFLMFVYGGFLWLISGGSSDRIKQGKNAMVWAALGLILVFSSAALVRFVLGLFGAGS